MRDRAELVAVEDEMIERIFHHCSTWEDYRNGMFRDVPRSGDDMMQAHAQALLSHTGKLKIAMLRVITEWPIATEENLSNLNQNRRAWLGWAACSLVCSAPDMITRRAWGCLMIAQQNAANAIADEVIEIWEQRYEQQRGQQWLFAS